MKSEILVGEQDGILHNYVQSYDEETDTLTIAYPSEPGCTYNINFSHAVFERKKD